MQYFFSKTLKSDFKQAITLVTSALKEEGFGILSEIDIQSTLKEKLNADFKPYRILGACNPPLAHQALQAEDKIGLMLPCNVVVIDQGKAGVEVAAVDPMASMQAIENSQLADVAKEVRSKLQKVIEGL